jgi:hypothetical protein
MGANQSMASNTVQDLTNISIDLTTNYVNQCSSNIEQQNLINISGCNNVDIENIQNKVNTVVNQSCIQNANTQSLLSANIVQNLKQAAEATSESLGIGNSSDASNAINLTTNLGLNVTTTYLNKCIQNISNQNTITCTNSSNVFISDLSNDNFAKVTNDCVQQDSTVNDIKTQLSQTISQSAVAKQSSLLDGIISIIAIIIIIVLIIFLFPIFS